MTATPSVAVFVTADTVFVISQQETDHGRVSVQPMLQLDKNASADAVGTAVLRCLHEFQEIDGPPDPDHLQELLEFVGANRKPSVRCCWNWPGSCYKSKHDIPHRSCNRHRRLR